MNEIISNFFYFQNEWSASADLFFCCCFFSEEDRTIIHSWIYQFLNILTQLIQSISK